MRGKAAAAETAKRRQAAALQRATCRSPLQGWRTTSMTETTKAPAEKKPRVALWIATGFGLGYLPVAPGTWGSLGGVVLTLAVCAPFLTLFGTIFRPISGLFVSLQNFVVYFEIVMLLAVSISGVWASDRVSKFIGKTDPQQIVIDEICGMSVTLVFGLGALWYTSAVTQMTDFVGVGRLFLMQVLNWKYLVVGFILFRMFDIVKPWPIRRLEKLPGGWGIMADDWFAGIYAAVVLWVVRTMGWLG
jgi:phosphatidylglycerophosphatase A